MSEQQNTALIQKLYDDFARGDIQAILAALTDDVEWTLEGPSIIPFVGARKGPSEVLGFFQALGTTQTNMKLKTEKWVAQGDTVATLGRYSGTVTATGKSFDVPVATARYPTLSISATPPPSPTPTPPSRLPPPKTWGRPSSVVVCLAALAVSPWRGHSCLQRRDSSRRSGALRCTVCAVFFR